MIELTATIQEKKSQVGLPTNSHEPSWGGVGSKKNRTYTNVNIALDRIHFPDNCDFESAKLHICTWNWCS